MQESHVEGVANHNDPESCVGAREDAGEALTGARTGRVSSREINRSERRRRPEKRKAIRCAPLARGAYRLCAVKDPVHVRNLLVRERRDPRAARVGTRAAPERPEAERR
jgi:hypothetical protein